MKISSLVIPAATAVILCGSGAVQAGSPAVSDVTVFDKDVIVEETSGLTLEKAFDFLWGVPVIYENEDNPYLQKVAFTGRYHGQLWGLNSDFGSASGWENRRQRFGGVVEFLETFEAAITFNLNFDGETTGRFVEDYEDFKVRWRPSKLFNLQVGLYKVPITNEWRESSNRIVTIERSNFINTAVPNKLGGILATGEFATGEESGVTYGAGVYSATRDDDWAYPTFDGGAVYYSGVGYNFNEHHLVRFDNGFTSDSPENNAVRPYSYTAALSYEGSFLDGRLGLQSDLVTAIGEDDQPDLFGIIILPTFDLTEKVQLVGRYQYLVSNEDNGVRLQSRYERRAPDLPTTSGNNYHALYGGMNYYIYKDRLKVMYGMEYSHLELQRGGGFNSLTIVGAVRVWF
ncbi:MAG: porin [Chthoniobacterales bacterium]